MTGRTRRPHTDGPAPTPGEPGVDATATQGEAPTPSGYPIGGEVEQEEPTAPSQIYTKGGNAGSDNGERRPDSPNREFDRVRKEQADFLASLSHDLRSPLTSLREFVSIVDEGLAGPVNDRQRDYLGIALRNADTLAEMMEHLLVLTEIQQGSYRLDRRRVDLAEILEDEAVVLGHPPKDKVVSLQVRIGPDLPEVYADPDRLLEALRNLVDNAVKYSGDAVVITIEARRGRGSTLDLFVRDNGFGMDATTRRNLFNRSYRGRQARRTSPGGLGLGLSIVKKIVDLHDGRVSVRSKLNEGTEFRLTLPLYVPREIFRSLLRKAWHTFAEDGVGFASVRAEVREAQGALSLSPEEVVQEIRELLRRTLGPDDSLVINCESGRAVIFLLSIGRDSVEGAVRKLLKKVQDRLRLQSGTYVEWESGPNWLHSDDFNHLEEMAETILHRWCSMGEGKDAT